MKCSTWWSCIIASFALITPWADAQVAPTPQREIVAPTTRSPNYDIVVFTDGTTLEGVVVSTTKDQVLVRLTVDGVSAVTRYPKANVQEIRPGAGGVIPPPPPRPEPSSCEVVIPSAPPFRPSLPQLDEPITQGGVYWITLTGKLGQEIAEPPLRDAFRDAKQFQPDVIVIEVNNTPARPTPPEDASEVSPELEMLWMIYDEIFRVEKLLRVPLEEVPEEWGKSPRIVYWVKNAVGGLCFLPLTGKEIYFAPNAKLIGCDDRPPFLRNRPRGCSRPLRLGYAVGWVIQSGYPQPELLTRGLLGKNIGLTVRIEDGRPVLFEGPPTSPNETPLTKQIAKGETNDILTLNAEIARLIGLSKGTVATREELLAALGLEGARVIADRADSIMKQWSEGVEDAHAQLARLITEYKAIKIKGDYDQRKAARAAAISCADQIKSIAKRWNEGLDPFRLHDSGLPAQYDGLDLSAIQQAIDRLRLDQSNDSR